MSRRYVLQFLPGRDTVDNVSSGRLREVENNRKFETVTPKSGRGRLWEVIAKGGSAVYVFFVEYLLNRFNPLKNLLLLYLYNVQFFTPSSSIISAAKAVLEDDSVAMKAISQFPTNKLINYVSTGSYRVRVLNHSLLTQWPPSDLPLLYN